MNATKLLLIVSIVQMFFSYPLRAEHYYYKQISLKAGLPSTVHCIAADNRGFVWMGTRSGLGRFDGQELKKYIHNSSLSNSLPGNQIYQIARGEQGNLWILTDKGISLYRYQSDDFLLQTDEKGENLIAYSVCRTPEGILFGGQGKIYHYSYKESCIRKIYEFKSEQNFNITALGLIDSHTILCCSRWQGMYLVDLQSGEYRRAPFGAEKEITGMLVDSKQRVWVASYNVGLRCFTRDGKQIALYTTRNSSLSNDIILSIVERKGQIWLGTDGGGINILNPETQQFSSLKHIPGKVNSSLPNNSIICLYNDQNNNIWIGSIYSGLISVREVYMQAYTDALPNNKQGLSDNIVLSLCQQESGHIWVGTNGGGINCFNSLAGEFTHYPSTLGDKVASICGFASGKLLLSIFAQGIFIFDPVTGNKQPFTIIDKEVNERLCLHGNTVNVYRNTPNTILLLGNHVYCYHLKEKQFSIVSEEKGINIIEGSLKAIACDGHSTYLNDIKHIYELDNHSNKLRVLFTAQDDMNINSVSMDESGCFWIGSNLGLVSYHPATQKQKMISTSLFTEVSSLICDQKGKIWVGAENRLFAWSIAEEKMALFGETDGAVPNEYFPEARLLSQQGDIYMGGVKGLLHIDGKLPLRNTNPQLQLSDIIINGEPANNKLYDGIRKLSVPWNSNIVIHVMAKEEDIFRQKVYRYQIKGLDEQLVESYSPELTMRALPPGNYQIMASCTTKDGSWVPAQQLLQLTISPPWYKTWWFILGCILLVAVIVIESVRKVLKRKEEKLRWEMKEHEQKTYEEKVRFLINISHELRTPLTLIYAPLKQILKSLSPQDAQYLPIKAIYRQSQRMKNLINMVLDVRKMEVGESRLQIEPQPLNEWIKHVSQDFISEGEAKSVHISYRFDSRIEAVSFDKNKCEIILSNLLINALKHSPQHTEITIVSELISERKRVRVSVIDQGSGLENVDTRKLFTRFYQGTKEQNGTGIGLSYSKILVELHGGSIGARDNQETGATFFFELPLRQDAEEIVCQPKAYLNELMSNDDSEHISKGEEFDTTSYTILVVDDNSDLTDFFSKALSEYFKKVLIASDGVEALQLVKSYTPDIIVSDVMMPRMNGYELCKGIKEDLAVSHIPIILLTARDDKESQISGYKNGADGYLTKPFEIEMLMELIRNRLKNREYTKKRYLDAGLIPAPEETTFSLADETFLVKLNRIIQENLSDTKLDVSFICKEVGMSRASLYTKLKALTGIGLNEYINKIRMEKAILLITATDFTFTDISEKVGFTTISYFSTAFKQYTGETPTAYRSRQKKKEQSAGIY